ncbi:hypothetical protein NEUTE2DRAFT_124468 [Neurospora tetrasperma FGSC 2509]|nr:hypothetical protein NEUTE2DRAFT_124468 [Neurospora tetrasperma FGSC 2509]
MAIARTSKFHTREAGKVIQMPNIECDEDKADPSALPVSSPDMEPITETSKEDFQTPKKRRIEEKRSEAANVFTPYLFMPNDKIEEGRSRDDQPARLAPPPNIFTPYVFGDESLGQDSDANEDIDYWRDSLSPKQRLRFALKKLLGCEVSQALAIISKHKTILRPLWLKQYWVKVQLVTSNLKWERQEHFTGIAHYLFTPQENGEKTCTKCETVDNHGPFAECVAGGRAVHRGACFSCYYKGEGKSCSLRIAREESAVYPKRRTVFSSNYSQH